MRLVRFARAYPNTFGTLTVLVVMGLVTVGMLLWNASLWIFLGMFVAFMLASSIRSDLRRRNRDG